MLKILTSSSSNHLGSAIWPRILPFAALILCLIATSSLSGPGKSFVNDELLNWAYPLRAALTGICLVIAWSRLGELRERLVSPAPSMFVAAATGLAVFVVWVTVGPLIRMGADAPSEGLPWPNDNHRSYIWIAFRLLGAVVIVPIVEEVFWRSYLMRRIDESNFLSLSPERVSLFAMCASSLVFALAHRELLAAFVCGLIYAELYRRSRNLWMPILAHAVTNASLGVYVLYTGKYEFW